MSYAATIQVPQDQPTIQVGINVARAGDKVKIAPGIYEENIILKTGIELVGAGADETIITSNKEGVVSAIGVGSDTTISILPIFAENEIECPNREKESLK